MIEITARLTNGSVYIAGEAIECVITFNNPGVDATVTGQSLNDMCETLAWASAQIHCQCTLSKEMVSLRRTSSIREEYTVSNKSTSFAPCAGERGHVVLATKPKILFCDVRLLCGENKSCKLDGRACSRKSRIGIRRKHTHMCRNKDFNLLVTNICETSQRDMFLEYIVKFSDVIPSDAPPSYRGHSVKYSYKITVGTQRVGSTIRLLRIPIRVLVLPGVLENNVLSYGDNGNLGPSNPFLENLHETSPSDLALELLQNLTAQKSENCFSITNTHGKVVRFCLFKLAYKLGEDIVGTFDFSSATVKCVQSNELLCNEKTGTVVNYNKYHEVCLFSRNTHVVLPIPLTVTPTFSTDLASLQWQLHFEFVTTITDFGGQGNQINIMDGGHWHGPHSLEIETMVWDLPISIFAAGAVQHTQGIQSKKNFTVVI